LLRGPLLQLGFVQIDDGWVAPTPAGRAWLADRTLPIPADAPQLDGCLIRLPSLTAGALRFQFAPWTEPQPPDPEGYMYLLTEASVRRGHALYGADRPLRALLGQLATPLPPAVRDLLAAARRPATAQIRAATLLQVDDPALLTTLLAHAPRRRDLGTRLGPTTALVRQERRLRGALRRLGVLPAGTPLTRAGPDSPPGAQTGLVVLALRQAQHAPSPYAPLFARLAFDLARTLTPADRAALDDLWLGLEPPEVEEEPVPPGEEPRSPLDPAALRRTLRRAIEEGQQLRIRYYTASRRVIGWRAINPLALRPLYVDAFCLRRRETLTFCLARILAVEGNLADPPILPLDSPAPPTPAPGAWLAEDYDEL
jgi:hypothetical protein